MLKEPSKAAGQSLKTAAVNDCIDGGLNHSPQSAVRGYYFHSL